MLPTDPTNFVNMKLVVFATFGITKLVFGLFRGSALYLFDCTEYVFGGDTHTQTDTHTETYTHR